MILVAMHVFGVVCVGRSDSVDSSTDCTRAEPDQQV